MRCGRRPAHHGTPIPGTDDRPFCPKDTASIFPGKQRDDRVVYLEASPGRALPLQTARAAHRMAVQGLCDRTPGCSGGEGTGRLCEDLRRDPRTAEDELEISFTVPHPDLRWAEDRRELPHLPREDRNHPLPRGLLQD